MATVSSYTKAGADAKFATKPTGTPTGSKFLRDDNSWQAPPSISGTPVGGDLTGTLPNPTLAAVGSAGTVGDASHSLTITTDTKGRVTSAATNAIQIAESQVTNLTTDLAGKAPVTRQLAGLDLTVDRTASALKTALAITEADVSGLTSDLAARALVMVPTATKTSAYTAAVNDLVLCDATTASFAVTLPTAPADKSIIEIKKIDSTANTVTITCGGSDTFVIGGTTLVLTLQGHAARVQYQSSTSKWITLDNDLPLTATDARYVGKSVVTAKGDAIIATASGTVTNVPVGSNGQRFTADSTQATGVAWVTPTEIGAPPRSAVSTSKYLRVPFTLSALAQNTAAMTDAQLWLMPLPVYAHCTLAELHGRVDTTAGTAGSVMRMGVYPLTAGASPLYDSGAIASTSASTTLVATANLALTPGWYLIAAVFQGNPATKPTTRQGFPNNWLPMGYSSAENYFSNDSGGPWAYTMSGVSGALPALGALTEVSGSGSYGPTVGLKFA